jgi:hypothetical protein
MLVLVDGELYHFLFIEVGVWLEGKRRELECRKKRALAGQTKWDKGRLKICSKIIIII